LNVTRIYDIVVLDVISAYCIYSSQVALSSAAVH